LRKAEGQPAITGVMMSVSRRVMMSVSRRVMMSVSRRVMMSVRRRVMMSVCRSRAGHVAVTCRSRLTGPKDDRGAWACT
jgi:hypothetical protein